MASQRRHHALSGLSAPYAVLGLLYLAVLIWAANWYGPLRFQPPYWTSWQDQSEYLRSAKAFAALRLDPADHWYPLLYPLIAAPFTLLTPAMPFALIDGLCILAAFAGFQRVADSFGVARWPALLLFALTTLIEPHVARNWAEPWTTTLSAALIWLALGQVIPMLIETPAGRSPTRLALLGGLLALIPMARPADALVSLILAGFLAKPLLLDQRDGRGVAAAIAGGAVPLAAYAALHLAIYGPHPSDYMRLSAAYGIDLGQLGWKAYLILVEPSPWFPGGRALLNACPWLILGAAGLVAGTIVPSERRLAASCLLTIALVYLAVILTYCDLLPTGFWKFNNVHYLKWLLPLFGLFAVVFVRDLPPSPAIGIASLVGLLLLACVRLTPVAAADETGARVLLFAAPPGDLSQIATAQSVIIDRRGERRNFFEYHQLPAGSRIMAVAMKRDFAGGERWIGQVSSPQRPWPRNVRGGYDTRPLPGPWPRRPIARYRPRPSLGLPCWLLPFACDPARAL